jgi:hypothetical protein
MIDIELRTPREEDDLDPAEWIARAGLRVAGQTFEVRGNERLFDFRVPVLSLRTGERLRWEDNKEEWARNLATAFHSPDLVVVVIEDDNPIPQAAFELDVTRHAVELPQPVTAW